ncbi:MAG: hypothetical protein K6G43_03085 [Lachnospiraceae bacterium]|nr:hypothetical protein [Lachnospiraceae bacterium]
MGSSEDYLDNLLKSMGVPNDVTTPGAQDSGDEDALKDAFDRGNDPASHASAEIEELTGKLPDSDVFVDHSADIPDLKTIIEEDPAASAVHIDSAPSLDMNSAGSSETDDLSDLMNDLMGKFDDPAGSDASEAPSREVITSEKYSLSDNPGEDLDSQIAALLSESGITLSEEEGLKIDPSFSKSAAADSSSDDNSSFDLDAELADLLKEENESVSLPGEEDIEAMLNKARSEGLADDPDRSQMSLDELLAADSSASEIGALLSKDENNEAVDPGIEALLNSKDEDVPDIYSDDTDAEDRLLDSATEKKRLKEEKKEAKRKAREAKKAARKARKAKKDAAGDVSDENELSFENIGNADMSDVDALLAGAAEAAADSKAASLSSQAVPIPRDVREHSQALDDADSLLAEIMGGNFGDTGDEPDADNKAEGAPEKSEIESPKAVSEEELDDILDKESKGKNKKKGLFSKLLSLLTDEDDEDEERSSLKLSDENAAVLDQLDAEGEGGGKKKKKKKKKDAKAEAQNTEDGGEEDEGSDKKAKKKKPKKEKKVKAPEEDEKPAKKLNIKKVAAVFGLCFTILVAVLIISRLMGAYTVKKEAREAYAAGDYQTAYQDLFGQELNESDEIIFKKSECILRIRLWLREYEILKEESDVKALDSLIQTVNRYPGLYQSAVKWNCLDEVEPLYRQMVDALETEYGLSEEEAMEIAMIKSNVDYTRAVYAVVNGLHEIHNEEPVEEEPLTRPDDHVEDEIPGESDPGSDAIFVNP